jgi:hypothetical protein
MTVFLALSERCPNVFCSENENLSGRINEIIRTMVSGNYGRHFWQRWSQRQERTSRQHERLQASLLQLAFNFSNQLLPAAVDVVLGVE